MHGLLQLQVRLQGLLQLQVQPQGLLQLLQLLQPQGSQGLLQLLQLLVLFFQVHPTGKVSVVQWQRHRHHTVHATTGHVGVSRPRLISVGGLLQLPLLVIW